MLIVVVIVFFKQEFSIFGDQHTCDSFVIALDYFGIHFRKKGALNGVGFRKIDLANGDGTDKKSDTTNEFLHINGICEVQNYERISSGNRMKLTCEKLFPESLWSFMKIEFKRTRKMTLI